MTTEEFINHDCKLSPESSCDTCEKFICRECEDTGKIKMDIGDGQSEEVDCPEIHECAYDPDKEI